ncbi:hypothetical protein CI610_00346 [invertebrate metagenome]|uniref:Prohead serine protease domain-containing protein n=1 Tax=invertebrate metagenome TaxID=1711999 RepID=A0A2H9TBR2_9ZZZZ
MYWGQMMPRNCKEVYSLFMNKTDYETRIGTVELRQEGQSDPKIVGYAARYDVLSENLGGFRETILPGAFDNVLDNDVRALFNHEPALILGRTVSGTLDITSDGDGLHYTIDPPDTQYARDLMKSMQRGDVSQSSFAFTVDRDSWDEDEDGRMVRTIHAVRRLYDISPVTYPAYPDTDAALRSVILKEAVTGRQALRSAQLYALEKL